MDSPDNAASVTVIGAILLLAGVEVGGTAISYTL
jgi:hypothetical protein